MIPEGKYDNWIIVGILAFVFLVIFPIMVYAQSAGPVAP